MQTLTPQELEMLKRIVSCYSEADNICYDTPLTPREKGLVGSLVKKDLVHDSFSGMHHEEGYEQPNWFPTWKGFEVIDELKTVNLK